MAKLAQWGTIDAVRDDRLTVREATNADAATIAEVVHAGFASYRSFAEPGWQPRTVEWSRRDIEERLGGVGVRARVALTAPDRAAGFCGWTPALTRDEPREPIAGLAHLWMLFVAPEWWGRGLASELLEWAHSGMIAADYDSARLWTPLAQVRARAFYERRGWRASGREDVSNELMLPLVEYRVELKG